MAFKLGRNPSKPEVLARLPKAAAHMANIGPVPDIVDWSRDVAPTVWGLYENDKIGDCTACGVAHCMIGWESLWASPATPMVFPTDDEVVTVYENFGYDPTQTQPDGTNPTDQGATCADVLNLWHNKGYVLGGALNRLMAHATVNPHNHDEVRAALYCFGSLYIGVALREAQMTEQVWQTVDGPIAGGHCVTIHRVDQDGGLLCSWGQLFRFTWSWFDGCIGECHAPLNSVWVHAGGAPQGLGVSSLEAEMVTLEQAA